MEKQKLLVALDEHSISTELVKYLGKIISGKKDLEVCLLHMLAPLPPELREFRGSEDAKLEEQLDREMGVAGPGRPRMRRGRCLRMQSLSSRAQESRRTRSAALFANLWITRTSPTISSNSPKKTRVKRSSWEGRHSHGSKKRFIVI
jgi:hypothetical protein